MVVGRTLVAIGRNGLLIVHFEQVAVVGMVGVGVGRTHGAGIRRHLILKFGPLTHRATFILAAINAHDSG